MIFDNAILLPFLYFCSECSHLVVGLVQAIPESLPGLFISVANCLHNGLFYRHKFANS